MNVDRILNDFSEYLAKEADDSHQKRDKSIGNGLAHEVVSFWQVREDAIRESLSVLNRMMDHRRTPNKTAAG